MFGAQVPLVWPLYPSILIGLAALTIAYVGAATRWRGQFPGARPLGPGRWSAFVAAIGCILLALQSPIDALSDDYLFSVHMVQHLLLTLVMPPLLLYAIPGWMLRPLIARAPFLLPIGRLLTSPLVAFALFNITFIGYHVPAIYDLVQTSEVLHIAAHLLFMGTGVITWWPILSPLAEVPALPRPLQLLYLFAQTLPSQALGAFQTFTSTLLYPRYVAAPRVWPALDPASDQQLGGVIMWVGGGTFFLGAFALVFIAWVAAGETRERRYRAVGRA